MGERKRRVPIQAVIPGLALFVILITAFGLFGPFTAAEEGNPVASADDVLEEATFYVA